MKANLSFRASKALHRMVFRAKRHPESSPAIGGIRAILDFRFHGNDGREIFAGGSYSFQIHFSNQTPQPLSLHSGEKGKGRRVF
jgi:hypothetical protein